MQRAGRLAGPIVALCLVSLAALPHRAFAAGAIYQGTIGDVPAQARLSFDNDKVSGIICTEAKGLVLRQIMYTVQGDNPPGKISARLTASGRPAGSLDGERKLSDDQVSWQGKSVIDGAAGKFELSRPRQQFEIYSPKTKFDSDDMLPDALQVWIDMRKYDQAAALMKQLEGISKIEQESSDDPNVFIYDNYMSDCSKQLLDRIFLHLTVDPFKLGDVYKRLVASGLFLGVSSIATPKGPDSIEITIPKKFFGADEPTQARISEFLDALIERYFRQLRQSPDACRKPNGESVLASLIQMQPNERSSVTISALQTGSFHVRRFEIKGLSKDLVFGLDSHWEDYKVELNLYPIFANSTEYEMQINVTTGLIAPFQEAMPPPVERYRPINDSQLNNFMQKFAACVSKYVTGGCTSGVEAVATNYCPQHQQ
jgi:hypothetical protein